MKLACKTFGTAGAPVLILHGLLGQADNWTTVAKAMAGDHVVHCLDQRNHGRSPHADQMSYEDMAADVCEFMDDRELDTVVLLGHSMGGKTAMQVAAVCPCRIARLIVVDIAPRAYPIRHRKAIEAMQAVNPADFATRGEVDRALSEHVPMPAIRRFLLKNVVAGPDGGLAWTVNVPAIAGAYEAIMGPVPAEWGFDGPTLFVRGEQSDYLADADIPVLEQRFPQAEFVTISGAGHWVHAEAPEAFLDVVRRFAASEPAAPKTQA